MRGTKKGISMLQGNQKGQKSSDVHQSKYKAPLSKGALISEDEAEYIYHPPFPMVNKTKAFPLTSDVEQEDDKT